MPNKTDIHLFEKRHHLPPFSDFKNLKEEGTRIITHAEGHTIFDSDGNAILDAMAGLWCVNVGYGRDELVNAATKQMHKLPYYNSFFKTSNEPVARLSAKLASIAPEHLNYVIYANSGSEANDTIIRLVRHYWALKGQPEKRVIIGREYGYHGSTIMAASMGGMKAMHEQSANEADFEHIRPPYGFLYQGNQTDAQFAETSAKLLRDKIIEVGADKIAAFIAEPVQGAGGVIIPPDGYFKHIQKICTEFDILFIADEVITGFGRTGNWFASQTMNLTPDLVTLAKGLTSGYVPMSAVLVSDKIASHLIEEGGEFYHGFTYSGHPVSAAVALANIELIETEGLIEHVRDITAPYLASAIKQLDSHPLVGQTRSFGLLACVELVRHKSGPVLFDPVGAVGTKCRDHAINNGLMVRAVRDGMILSPPLSFQVQDIDITIYKLKQALDATYAEIGNG
ncbi:aminotransferase [Alphaproteobacteria bacterium]|nr:aminotransferase [Alphaproteobacteria bacterium]